MRIFLSSIVTVVGSSCAGALLATAFSQQNLMMCAVFACAGLLLACGVLVWQCMKFQQGVHSLEKFVKDPSSGPIASFAFIEFERIASQLQRALNGESKSPTDPTSQNQIANIERTLKNWEIKNNLSSRSNAGLDERLDELVNTIRKQVDSGMTQALACSREIGRGAQKLVASADEQSDSVSRITNVIESLSGEILALGENAETAVESSATAQQFAITGLDDFQDIVRELEGVKNHVSTRERKLQQLGQHSREIGNIVQAVGTLSSRTDLLALNASIESARAGEHGRGFALVAEEVRALAEQSAQSVADINARVDLIQQETQESIAVAFGEHNQINQLIKRLQETLNSMKKMSEASSYCASSVTEISQKTEDQLQLLTEIVNELESSSEISKDNRIQAEGVHWTARTLQQLGQQFNGQAINSQNGFPNSPMPPEVATQHVGS